MATQAPVEPSWAQGDPYERYMGRWSRQVAPRFLAWLDAPAGRDWLDVGCGTGALSAAILEHCRPRSVQGVEPSAGFLSKAQAQLGAGVRLQQARADAMPLAGGAVQVTVSGLVLNFVPDAAAAVAEMRRVTAAGGLVAAYVWDYAGGMELMRHFWDAAAEADPAAAALDQGMRYPVCSAPALQALFAGAGLRGVRGTAIGIPTVFAGFDDYWQPFLGGQGTAPAYLATLDEQRRARIRDLLRARLPVAPDGSIALGARALAVCGEVPSG